MSWIYRLIVVYGIGTLVLLFAHAGWPFLYDVDTAGEQVSTVGLPDAILLLVFAGQVIVPRIARHLLRDPIKEIRLTVCCLVVGLLYPLCYGVFVTALPASDAAGARTVEGMSYLAVGWVMLLWASYVVQARLRDLGLTGARFWALWPWRKEDPTARGRGPSDESQEGRDDS